MEIREAQAKIRSLEKMLMDEIIKLEKTTGLIVDEVYIHRQYNVTGPIEDVSLKVIIEGMELLKVRKAID